MLSYTNQTARPGRGARRLTILLSLVCMAMLALPISASQAGGGIGLSPTTGGKKAKLVNGKAVAPKSAPKAVKRAIDAANRIRNKPYIYGGGHAKWIDKGYDCSGSVSFALGKYGAHKLKRPLPSTGFMKNGVFQPGKGRWITTYANSGHMYAVIAGLRFDTSGRKNNHSTRWHKDLRGGKVNGPFHVRHPKGL